MAGTGTGTGTSNTNPLTLPVTLNPFAPTSTHASSNIINSSSASATASTGPASSSHLRLSTGSNNTYVMSGSPRRNIRKRNHEPYMPKIITTVGQRPACLVNASVTYVGKDEIYAFGGFDQFTDEVYNHVLRLNLNAKQWNLVDNYGDIPGVRMGESSCWTLVLNTNHQGGPSADCVSVRAHCMSMAE